MNRYLPMIMLVAFRGTALADESQCSLALQLSPASYSALRQAKESNSQAALDNFAYDWAKCHEQALTARLKSNPTLALKVQSLRMKYQAYRVTESRIGELLNGAGTRYGHFIPRSFPEIEITLNDYAVLSQTPGGTTVKDAWKSTESDMQDVASSVRARLAGLRKLKPASFGALTDKDIDTYLAVVAEYELAYRSIVETLGGEYTPRNVVALRPFSTSYLLDPSLR